MLSQDSEDEIRSRFVFELAIWLWQDELNPRVRCAFGNVWSVKSVSYESFATVGEIRVWWRADFQSGSRVLKKVFWTFSYLYLWHTMWFHAKKLLKTLKFWKSLNSLCKSGSRPQKSPKKAQKTDHSIAIYSNFWIGMVYFGYHLVKAHVQTVQNMYGKGGWGVCKAELRPPEVDPYFERKKISLGGVTKNY